MGGVFSDVKCDLSICFKYLQVIIYSIIFCTLTWFLMLSACLGEVCFFFLVMCVIFLFCEKTCLEALRLWG